MLINNADDVVIELNWATRKEDTLVIQNKPPYRKRGEIEKRNICLINQFRSLSFEL